MGLPVLSICIPTFNRSQYLKECLESVLSSAKGYEDQIEIVISDNASTDDTASVVSEFEKRSSRIRYHRNDTNIYIENFFVVSGLALGEYVWIFGDDDKVMDGAIPTILNRIKSGYDLIFCNYSIWSKDFSTLQNERNRLVDLEEEYNDANLLLERIGIYLGYISICIIKKNVFFSTPPGLHMEYGFPHVYCMYAGLATNCRAVYIPATLVLNRAGNVYLPEWNKFFITGTSLVFEALLEKGYTQKAVYRAKHQHLRSIISYSWTQSQSSADLKTVAQLALPHYKKDWLFWVTCMPIAYLPVPRFFLRFTIKMAQLVLVVNRSVSRRFNHAFSFLARRR
ncbi:MAG: glycosyltransferase family 2 protein [Chloroflexi bacterium]|nr:glycosyltransferase family 2 protein [Chloroflexota bacterium]